MKLESWGIMDDVKQYFESCSDNDIDGEINGDTAQGEGDMILH